MRKMASVRVVSGVRDIPEADKIQTYIIDGWEIVDAKGKYSIGDKIIMCEIDSWIPISIAPFLRKTEKVRVYKGVDGERLKTIRLRGQLSQGLIIPLPADLQCAEIGADLSEQFNIQKWEADIPVQLAGLVRGNFPSQIQKTDQDRIQNVFGRIKRMIEDGELVDEWVVQEKLEGSSMQVAVIKGAADDGTDENHVLSRNLSLKLDQEGNAYVDLAIRDRLIDLVNSVDTEYPVLSIQGEMIGPGIQGNIYKLEKPEFRVFDIWVGSRHMSLPELIEFRSRAQELGFELQMVPVIPGIVSGLFAGDYMLKEILATATGPSALNPKQLREGLVYKNLRNPNVTFKAISNEYLLKQKD